MPEADGSGRHLPHDLPAPFLSFSVMSLLHRVPSPGVRSRNSLYTPTSGAAEEIPSSVRPRGRAAAAAPPQGGAEGREEWRAPRPAALRAVRGRLRESPARPGLPRPCPDPRPGFPRLGFLRLGFLGGKTASRQPFLLLRLLRKCPAGKFAAGSEGRPGGLCGGG